MERFALEEAERPFIGKGKDAEEKIEQLENGDRLNDGVKVGGSKVPEDLGPEEAFDCSGDLVWRTQSDQHTDDINMKVRNVNLQIAAVITTRRAQWFLMSLPIALSLNPWLTLTLSIVVDSESIWPSRRTGLKGWKQVGKVVVLMS